MTKLVPTTAFEGAPGTGIDRDLRPHRPWLGIAPEWSRWAGPIVSLLILGTAAYQLRHVNIREILRLVPVSPMFWMLFGLYYSANPISEWVIFRRLWSLPPGGIIALYRKLVSNELLLGYLGEIYFYAWARARTALVAAPFGAVKDVAVLSALIGNTATLAMVLAATPFLPMSHPGLTDHTWAISLAVMLASSSAIMLLRRRLFSLPQRTLWFVAGVHLLRIVAVIGLSAVLWHLVLPSVAIGWWLLLATLRQLVSRLPLVPNKDVVFAGMAMFLVGRDAAPVNAVTVVASLMLLANVLVGMALGLAELLRMDRES